MNARIINLRTRRKQKARADKTAQGSANAVKFGRTKTEKTEADASRAQDVRNLDGHKLDKSSDADDD